MHKKNIENHRKNLIAFDVNLNIPMLLISHYFVGRIFDNIHIYNCFSIFQ